MRYKSLILFTIIFSLMIVSFASATTELEIIKYAEDGDTILGEDSVDYKWMKQNLPVQGDGVTHYYLQGPVFEAKWSEVHPDLPYDMWNPQEDINYERKDLGAVKGTSLRDICNLAGGMDDGDVVRVQAEDGFYKEFPYENVYSPQSAQGEIIVVWYSLFEDGNGGYVPEDYRDGMRLAFLADTSGNPAGDHVFGITDMRNTLPEDYWHYFNGEYPTTTGLSVRGISKIIIYSDDEAPPGKITVKSEPKGAGVYLNEEYIGTTDITIEDLNDGDYEVSVRLEGYKTPDSKTATVTKASESVLEFVLEENFSGYGGHELKIFRKSEVNGNLKIFYSEADPFILSQGKKKEIKLNTGIDDYSNVTYLRLWVYAGDSHSKNDNSGLKPKITIIANGKTLTAQNEYYDRKNDGDREYSATFAYTPEINSFKKPEIIFGISNSGTNSEVFTVYGIALLIEEKSGNITTSWEGYEGCDIIWPGYGNNDLTYYSYAIPDTLKDGVSEAEVTCIATAKTDASPEDLSFEFNGGEWPEIFSGDDYGLLNRTFDVFLFLDGISITTGIKSESSSDDKGYFEARNLILSGIITENPSDVINTRHISSLNNSRITGNNTDNVKKSGTDYYNDTNTVADNQSLSLYSDREDNRDRHGFFESVFESIIAFLSGIFTGNVDNTDQKDYNSSLCKGFNESQRDLKQSIDSGEPDKADDNSGRGVISIDSVPKDALIYIDGTYTGKITPCIFGSFNIDGHLLRLEKEGFNPYETVINAKEEEIKPFLSPSDNGISKKSLHSAETGDETISETGSLYVSALSKNLAIYVDNQDTSKKTPAVISGLKPGVHTIRLKSYANSGDNSKNIGSRKVYVYANSIIPVFISKSEKTAGEVSFVSDAYNKKPVSVNGISQNYKIPAKSDEIYYGETYLCIDDNGKYISCYIPADSCVTGKFEIPEYTGKYYRAYFDSEPKGADIFIDGFDTGFHTPFMINNLSTREHKIVISKPGYIPATGTVMIPEGKDESFAGVINCQLKEYPTGSVFADTMPSGAKVYINGVNSGEKTPVIFPYLNIGTYEFRFINGSVKSGSLEVTVNPWIKTEIIEDMQ